jgi:hypothetical protein
VKRGIQGAQVRLCGFARDLLKALRDAVAAGRSKRQNLEHQRGLIEGYVPFSLGVRGSRAILRGFAPRIGGSSKNTWNDLWRCLRVFRRRRKPHGTKNLAASLGPARTHRPRFSRLLISYTEPRSPAIRPGSGSLPETLRIPQRQSWPKTPIWPPLPRPGDLV